MKLFRMRALSVAVAVFASMMLSEVTADIVIGGLTIDINPNDIISDVLGVLRERLFTVPTEMLSFDAGQTATFILFDGEIAHGTVTEVVQRGGDSASWQGTISSVSVTALTTDRPGTFILSVYEGSWLANLQFEDSPGLQYEIRPYIDGEGSLFRLMLVDTALRYTDADADHGDGAVGDIRRRRGLQGGVGAMKAAMRGLVRSPVYQPDHDDILDVGVLWTPQALVAAGGTAAMMNKVNVAIDESNAIFKNSDVSLRVRLASAHVVHDTSYVEPTSNAFPTMFFDLLDLTDGVFDVDTNVNRYSDGADVLVLIVADGSYCGVGAQINGDSDKGTGAHAVIAQGCVTGIFSFLHEIGHMLGANHDFSAGKYSYSRGSCWLGPEGDCASCGRSLMAYSSCTTSTGNCNGCTRKPYWSNPDVLAGGFAVGSATNDNAATVNETRHLAVTWANTTFSGGIISSVSPSSVAVTGTDLITISGWRLSNGDVITSVTLNGFEATIISQNKDSVVVAASGNNANSNGMYAPVVVSTSGGRVTSLNGLIFTGSPHPTANPTSEPTFKPSLMPSSPTYSPSALPTTASPSTAAPTKNLFDILLPPFLSGIGIADAPVAAPSMQEPSVTKRRLQTDSGSSTISQLEESYSRISGFNPTPYYGIGLVVLMVVTGFVVSCGLVSNVRTDEKPGEGVPSL